MEEKDLLNRISAPSKRSANVTMRGTADAKAFESYYRDCKDSLYFNDAYTVFSNKTLNSPPRQQFVTGVNTWHAQVLAGRVTVEEVKTIGYKNIRNHYEYSRELLTLLVRDENNDGKQRVDARGIKAAINAAKTSLVSGDYFPKLTDSSITIEFTLFFAEVFGADRTLALRHHRGIYHAVGNTILKLDTEEAWVLAVYVDEFFAKMLEQVQERLEHPFYGQKHLPNRFLNNDFLLLMNHGVTSERAAELVLAGFNAERAVQSISVSKAVSDGVL